MLETIPGIDRYATENTIAMIVVNIEQYPSAFQLASWAGICLGNNESTGKQKSGKTPNGNPWLRRTLGESGWAVGKTKNTYLSAQYHRIMSRRGKKRELILNPLGFRGWIRGDLSPSVGSRGPPWKKMFDCL